MAELAKTGSVDVCSVQPKNQFVGTRQRMDTTRALSVERFLPHMGAVGERPEVDVKPPFGAQLPIFAGGYLLKSFPHDIIARQRRFEIRIFFLYVYCI